MYSETHKNELIKNISMIVKKFKSLRKKKS